MIKLIYRSETVTVSENMTTAISDNHRKGFPFPFITYKSKIKTLKILTAEKEN
jgi:hypothetical protein